MYPETIDGTKSSNLLFSGKLYHHGFHVSSTFNMFGTNKE